jgi:type I restriction enzyme, R subunit
VHDWRSALVAAHCFEPRHFDAVHRADRLIATLRRRTGRCAPSLASRKSPTVMQILLKDDTQVYKQFVENESFKRLIGDMVYAITNP